MQQPRALNIMPIALQVSGTSGPVHFKEQIQMVGLFVQDLICKDIYQIPEGTFHHADGLLGHTDAHRQNSA